jgi:hypothetical protein
MSFVGAIFVFLYILCGLAVCREFAVHFGPIFGVVGFVLGVGFGMIVWRVIARFCFRRKPQQADSEKKSGV